MTPRFFPNFGLDTAHSREERDYVPYVELPWTFYRALEDKLTVRELVALRRTDKYNRDYVDQYRASRPAILDLVHLPRRHITEYLKHVNRLVLFHESLKPNPDAYLYALHALTASVSNLDRAKLQRSIHVLANDDRAGNLFHALKVIDCYLAFQKAGLTPAQIEQLNIEFRDAIHAAPYINLRGATLTANMELDHIDLHNADLSYTHIFADFNSSIMDYVDLSHAIIHGVARFDDAIIDDIIIENASVDADANIEYDFDMEAAREGFSAIEIWSDVHPLVAEIFTRQILWQVNPQQEERQEGGCTIC